MRCSDRLNVLIACEESQAEMLAFLDLGFNAFSCDIQKARFRPDRHILGDVSPYLQGKTKFKTEDGKRHQVTRWHLIIAHPPCTYLCRVSSVQLMANPNKEIVFNGKVKLVNADRYQKMMDARDFFFKCMQADAPFVAVENPIPMAIAQLPRPSCYVEPFWYGVKYSKKTLYWLKNLPPIMPEIINPDHKEFVRASRGKYRSRTFPQVAKAIAEQWGTYIRDAWLP